MRTTLASAGFCPGRVPVRDLHIFPCEGVPVNFSSSFAPRLLSWPLALLIVCLILQGCGTMKNGRRWGEDATLLPGWKKAGESAFDALMSPLVLIPAAGALLLQIDHGDRRISDWAREHTPVYGSNDKADQRSEDIRGVMACTFYLSMLATPSGDDLTSWGASKVKGALVQQAAVGFNHLIVSNSQDAIGRERPNNSDKRSFPSSRAANTAAFATLSSRNVDAMNIPQPAKTTLNAGLYTAMFATAWARVEAGRHYPSDVLAGISLGHLTSSIINDTFMGIDSKVNGHPVASCNGKELFIGYCLRF